MDTYFLSFNWFKIKSRKIKNLIYKLNYKIKSACVSIKKNNILIDTLRSYYRIVTWKNFYGPPTYFLTSPLLGLSNSLSIFFTTTVYIPAASSPSFPIVALHPSGLEWKIYVCSVCPTSLFLFYFPLMHFTAVHSTKK